MTGQRGESRFFSDAELTAHLDGALDEADAAAIEDRLATDASLRDRLALLDAGGLDFRAAYEGLLAEAPQDRLQARLDAATRSATTPAAGKRAWRPLALAAGIAVAFFLAGAAADRLIFPAHEAEVSDVASGGDEDQDWRQVVALYFSLYSADTLQGFSDDAAARQRALDLMGKRLGTTLDQKSVAIASADFKAARLLSYDDKPLGQILYLDPRYGPLALCITRAEGDEEAPASERRLGLNIAHWSRGGLSYMLIGRNPPADLEHLADGLATRLAS